MTKSDRVREEVTELPGGDYFEVRLARGWRLVALEWERGAAEERDAVAGGTGYPVPFGLRVSPDGRHLESEPREQEALALILALTAKDWPLSRVARALNEQGFRTRSGAAWTQTAVFRTLPRLIEAAPRILTARDWSERKARLVERCGA